MPQTPDDLDMFMHRQLTRRQLVGGVVATLASPGLATSKLRVAEFARIRGVAEGGVQPATARILGNSATSARNAQPRRLATKARAADVPADPTVRGPFRDERRIV